jgi:outer membrane protein assembly factor BamB
MATVSAPAVSGGLVVVAGVYDCNAPQLTVAALQATTGRVVWQRSVAAQYVCPVDVALHVADGVVVAGGPFGGTADLPGSCAVSGAAVVAPLAVGLDLSTGRQRWRAPASAGQVLAATSDIVIARDANHGCLVGLDAATGRLRWTVTPPVSPIFAATTADSAFLEGQVAGGAVAVSAVDPRTGHKQWHAALPPDPVGGMGPLAVGDVVVAGTYTTIGFDPATGRQMWITNEHGHTRTSTAPGLVLVAHLSGSTYTVEARDPRTGVRRWRSDPFSPSIGVALAVTDGAVVVALRLRSTAGFSAADGHPLWTVPGVFADAAVTTDAVYLASPSAPKNPPLGD